MRYLLLLHVLLVGCGESPEEKERAKNFRIARLNVKSLATACGTFELNNDRRPFNLEELTTLQPNGERRLVPFWALTDPWGEPYQYDSRGPKHGGKDVDVWTKTPDGKTIGNWSADPGSGTSD